MMAIGAKRRDILQLFLYQSTIIGLLGGLLGCILGASGSWFVVDLLNNSVKTLGGVIGGGSIQTIYAPEWFLIASICRHPHWNSCRCITCTKSSKDGSVVALRYE